MTSQPEQVKHFFGSYLGNKSGDYKDIEPYLPDNVKTVVEPFAGTFATSRLHYYNWKKYKVHVNDISPSIAAVVQLIRDTYPKFLKVLGRLRAKTQEGYNRNEFEKIVDSLG